MTVFGFCLAWFLSGLVITTIPFIIMDCFKTLEKDITKHKILKFILTFGVFEVFASIIGGFVSFAMTEFNPWICFFGGNLILYIISYLETKIAGLS